MKNQSEKKLIRQRRRQFIRQFYRGNKAAFICTILLQPITVGINVGMAVVCQMVIDVITGDSNRTLSQVFFYAVGILFVFVTALLLERIVKPRFIERAMCRYKEYAFSELTKKSISAFSKENTGRYLSVLTSDAAEVENQYVEQQFYLYAYAALFVEALVMMLLYSPLLTAIAFVFTLLPLLVSLKTGGRLAEKDRIISDRRELFVGSLKDWLAGFPVIKSFRAEKEAIESFQKENRLLEDMRQDRKRLYWTIEALSSWGTTFAVLGMYFMGTLLSGKAAFGITAGTVIAFVNLMDYINYPLTVLPQFWSSRKSAIKLIDKLAALLQENVRSEGGERLTGLEEGIRVENLSYAYEEDKPVLQSVSQNFEAGKSYAIVGASGSGKSTLLSLLMGSYDAYEGSIFFDGKELKQMQSDSLYELMTMVQQSVFIFNDTIRNNITMFREFPDTQVESVIRQSGLAALIADKGEDYVCGENGNGLSGGEKQRISIARALLRGAPVMLVDEATAALDAATAYEVTSAILDIEAFTRIVVTHRLEEGLLKRYDEILVMKSGSICEKGSFAELMAQKGLFYSLFVVAQS